MTPAHKMELIGFVAFVWFAGSFYLAFKLGQFMKEDERLFGYTVPRRLRGTDAQ